MNINEESPQSLDTVMFPPVGIAHLTNDIVDLLKDYAGGKTKVNVHCASQPNSYPHLGTVMTIMTSFALAKHIGDHYNILGEIKFEEIDNAPAKKIKKDGIIYSRSISQEKEDDMSISEKYMRVYRKLFDYLKKVSGISYSIRPFSQYQKNPFVRKNLKKILNRKEKFIRVLNPSSNRLHIRIQCPKCGYIDKSGVNLTISKLDSGNYILKNFCFNHGEFEALLSEDSKDYFDTNTPITDVLQGALFIEEDSRENAISIMVDGNDWSGVWALSVFCRGLALLGYKYHQFPFHFYSPLITDWSGAKFSKSVYIQTEMYSYLPEEFVNFSKFLSKRGEPGLNRFWEEVVLWVKEPKRLFRDYSVDYFNLLLKQK